MTSFARPVAVAAARADVPGLAFAVAFGGLVFASAVLAAAIPVQFSIAIVFLFAGPHNWFEARYMIGRLPARAGRLLPFLVVAMAGAAGLAGAFAALPWIVGFTGCDPRLAFAAWNASVIAWIALLVDIRSRTNPRFDGQWVWPLAAVVAAVQWHDPIFFNIALVYLHPLMAIAVLDRELHRSRRSWIGPWRVSLCMVPIGIVVIAFVGRPLAGAEVDPLAVESLIRHSGADLFESLPSNLVVAVHAFLEMVHYGVWAMLLPWLGMSAGVWKLDATPLARRGRAWRIGLTVFLGVGLMAVFVLWSCFLVDYDATRRIYFTVAVLHVLAEIPFLLRLS